MPIINNDIQNSKNPIVVSIFIAINFIFITILFCNSIKDFIFIVFYHLFVKKKKIKILNQTSLSQSYKKIKPKVILLYTTCNDFDSQSLIKSSQQNYENYEVYILDDSYEQKYINQIDEFVKKHKNKFKLVRRKNREGFKAGNINNFLKNKNLEYDYFVLLDSDEIIPNNFISETLKYFVNEKIGVVQANHKGTRGKNLFDSTGELGIYPAWTAFIKIKNEYGVVTLNGHGAIISRKCYEDTKGFPSLVAEDLAFTINLMDKGYKVVFADDVICEEVFPIDYLAFKKRSIKWTQGNIQFFKAMWLKMLKLNISFFKKIDLWLSTTSLSLSIFSIFVVIINFSILYPLGFKHSHLYILLIFMVIFLITPFINDFIFLIKKIKFWKLLFYILFCLMLYTSMIVCSIKTLILTLLGKKAKFIITPKNQKKYSFWEAIKINWLELLIANLLVIWMILIWIYLPEYKFLGIAILSILTISLYSTIFLTLLSNKKIVKYND